MGLISLSPAIAIVASVCLLLITSPALVDALSQEQIEMVEKIIYTEFMPQGKVPGMAISIVHGDQVHSAGHGYANRELGIPATNDTLFAVGSLSKMLSSTFIVHFLSERFPELGEEVLDTPIKQLAPNFDLVMSDRYRTEYMTFRDILAHKVCIQDFEFHLSVIAGVANKNETVYQRRYAPEICHFRNPQIMYSNIMIQVAAEAVVSIAGGGSTFEELAVAFYRRMGMRDIRFINYEDDYAQLPRMSRPYYFRDGRLNPMNTELIKHISPVSSGGGILATSNDMVHYMNCMLNRGRVGDVQLVKEEVIDWITRISTVYRFDSYRKPPGQEQQTPYATLGYGLGMMLHVYDWYQMFGHEGNVQPYTTLIHMVPALGVGIFTTTSGPGTDPLPDHYKIHFRLIESLLAELEPSRAPYHPASPITVPKFMRESDLLAAQPQIRRRTPPQAKMSTAPNTRAINPEDIVGHYGAVLKGVFNITYVDSSRLYFSYGRWATGYLTQRPTTPAIYYFEFDSDLPQHYFTYALPFVPPFHIDFSVPGTARLSYGEGIDYWFKKDWSLDQEPVVPWEPDSCGPSRN